MALETIPTPEKQKHIPYLTDEDYVNIFAGNKKEDVVEWMEQEGIEPDEEGYVNVHMNGKNERIDVVDNLGHFYRTLDEGEDE